MGNEIASTLVGAILPPLVDVVNAKVSNQKVRYLIAFAISMLFGAVVTYFVNGLHSLEDLIINVGLVFAAGQTVYMTYWKESTVRETVIGS